MNIKVNYAVSIFMTAIMLCGMSGCGSRDDREHVMDVVEEQDINQVIDTSGTQENNNTTDIIETQESNLTDDTVKTQKNSQNAESENLSAAASGEDLDVIAPDPADDDWYKKGNIYTDESGRRLEVFFNDEGMIEFAIDGLSVYFTTVGTCQFENNWRIYTCDDGTMIVYYPGEPAHIEISDGDYAGLYEEGSDK
ncbi:MAG: hypothetical protein K2N85_13250 [Lachnospiraceae bacterium]|nr:hypothetical protein [Lachnospiraceae bacterium]